MTPEELEILEALEGETEPVEYVEMLWNRGHDIDWSALVDNLEEGGYIRQEPLSHYSLTRAGREVLALRRSLSRSQNVLRMM